jgi:hypothetical protein
MALSTIDAWLALRPTQRRTRKSVFDIPEVPPSPKEGLKQMAQSSRLLPRKPVRAMQAACCAAANGAVMSATAVTRKPLRMVQSILIAPGRDRQEVRLIEALSVDGDRTRLAALR